MKSCSTALLLLSQYFGLWPFLQMYASISLGFTGDSVVKDLPPNAGDMGSSPGLGRSPGEGTGNPLRLLTWEIP